MSDENPIVTWAVELTGERGALIKWHQLFEDPKPTYVEVRDEGGDRFYLRSDRFDGQRETEVRWLAAELVRQLSSIIVATGSGQALTSGKLTAIRADGSRSSIPVPGTFLGVAMAAMAADWAPKNAVRAKVERWLVLAEREGNVSDAITFLARGSWFDLYFACEAMAKDCGGEHKLMKKPWARESRLKHVKENANYYRHYRLKCPKHDLSLVVRRNHRIPLSSGACDTAACARGSVLK
jgi:hypothetical protein